MYRTVRSPQFRLTTPGTVVGMPVRVQPALGTYDATGHTVPKVIYPRVADDGSLTFVVWTGTYIVQVPGHAAYRITVLPGTGDLSLEALRAATEGMQQPDAPNALQVLIDAHEQQFHAGTGSGGVDSTGLVAIAGTTLSGHRVAWLDLNNAAQYADCRDVSAVRVAGVTTGAADMGQPVTIQTGSVLTEPTWNWQPGPVWFGQQGFLTQVPPSGLPAGYSVQMGVALRPTALLIRIAQPIKLAA